MGHSKRTLSDLEGILTLKKNRLPSEPSGEREIKIHVITSFPNPGPLVINPFSHGNNYFFSCVFYFKSKEHGLAFCLPMACILLVPFFFFLAIFGSGSKSYKNSIFYTHFEDASWVHEAV